MTHSNKIISNQISWGKVSFPLRLFLSLMLGVAALAYFSLLTSIYLDTEFKIPLITEGYGSMGNIELVQHSLQYLYWFLGIFGFMGLLFLLSPITESVKQFFAWAVPLLIILDILSAWLVRVHAEFAYMLFLSGFLLAFSFLYCFVTVQFHLWFQKPDAER